MPMAIYPALRETICCCAAERAAPIMLMTGSRGAAEEVARPESSQTNWCAAPTMAVPATNMSRRMKEAASVERQDQVGAADDENVFGVNVLLVNHRRKRCRPP